MVDQKKATTPAVEYPSQHFATYEVGHNAALHIQVSSAAAQGGRKTMEDCHVVISHLNALLGSPDEFPQQAFFGVYDGHSGNAAADYSKIHLRIHTPRYQLMVIDWNIATDENFVDNLPQAFVNAYRKTDRDFNENAILDNLTAGTTAVTILLRDDKIYISNVGDSEAVLCRQGEPAIVLSVKHLPDIPEEKERICKSGGTVVWYGTWRVNGLLSVSRSIGDSSMNTIVIAEPTVR